MRTRFDMAIALGSVGFLACAGGNSGSGSSSSVSGGISGGTTIGTTTTAGATSGNGSSSSGSCVPQIPNLAWSSPFAGFSNWVTSDAGFFPIGVWLQGSQHAHEMASIGIDLFVGNTATVDPLQQSDLATLAAAGMHAIVAPDSVGFANMDSGVIVGWALGPDEPDNAQPTDAGGYGPPVAPSVMVSHYEAVKAVDTTRPVYIGLGQGVANSAWVGRGSNPPPESGYAPAADLLDFDIYPYNGCAEAGNAICGEFWLNALGVDDLRMWSTRNQAVETDFETTAIDTADAGPTPVETASEVWLSLIHGANMVTYFVDTWVPHFREDGIFNNPAMVTAITNLDQQIHSLGPELNSASLPNLVTVMSSNAATPIDFVVKARGSSLYIFSAISRTGATMGTFQIVGMSGNGTATALGEGRTVPISAGAFSDSFGANDVHLYQVDLSRAICP